MKKIYNNNDADAIAAVVDSLKQANLAIIPTDTVYGLAAYPKTPAAIEKIYKAKRRDVRKPIASLASDIETVEKNAHMSETAKQLAEQYWPGALTLILKTGQNQYEGFRIPDHELTREIIRQCGGLLKVTSANLSGEPDACTIDEAVDYIGDYATIGIDDGKSPGNIPSTVVKDTPEGIIILRQGSCNIRIPNP